MRNVKVVKVYLNSSKIKSVNELSDRLKNTKIIYNNFDNIENKNSPKLKNLINRINNIFLSKTNCPKFSYHPLINYSIGKYGLYSLYFNAIFTEISYFKNDKLETIEKTFFNPNSQSFAINFQNLTFIFNMFNNKIKIFSNLKDYYITFGISDIKKIRKNQIDLNSKINNLTINYNNLKLNPFNDLKEKILCFSCKKNDEIIEIKYGFTQIYLDGFYETKSLMNLPLYENKEIIIKNNSLIILEINNNCNAKQMKEIIDNKIKIFKTLEISKSNVYIFGIISKEKKKEDEKKTLYPKNEKIFYEEQNYKIFIYECNNNFLGYEIHELNENDKVNENSIQKKLDNRKLTFDYNKNESVILNNKENILTNSNLINDSNISSNTTLINSKNEHNKNKSIEVKIIKKKYQRKTSNYSLFDDDLLYCQMIIN